MEETKANPASIWTIIRFAREEWSLLWIAFIAALLRGTSFPIFSIIYGQMFKACSFSEISPLFIFIYLLCLELSNWNRRRKVERRCTQFDILQFVGHFLRNNSRILQFNAADINTNLRLEHRVICSVRRENR